MKRLYLRVYLGFLVVLVTFAVLAGAAAWIGRAAFDEDFSERPGLRSGFVYLLTRAIPPPGAELDAIRAALDTLSARFRMDLTLYDASRRVVAAAGPPVPPPRWWRRGESAPPHQAEGRRRDGHGDARGPRRPIAIRLEDGRWIAARRRFTSPWTGWLPGWLPHWLPLWVGPLFLLAIAIGVGVWPLARGLTRRIERLQARVDELGAGSLSSRVEVEGRDEVARLAESFNRAADRIERLVDAQRHILAGASHELRTPLTRIRMAIELVEGNPERRASIERDIAELDELIEELLTAARLDAPESLGDAEPVDALALLAEEAVRVGADVRGEPVSVMVVERLFRRLCRNLLENARRHGEGSPISVEAVRRHGAAENTAAEGGARAPEVAIRVTNGGPAIPAHLRERIFEPFFRIEAASGRAGERGVGLGLVLVRRIAEHHGGRARLVESGSAGTTFEVTLPLG